MTTIGSTSSSISIQRSASAIPRLVVLSSSLLTDRMLLHTNFLHRLATEASVRLWATSANESQHSFLPTEIVEPFPSIRPFKEFPYNVLRRLNEFVWDYRLEPPSRMSRLRHGSGYGHPVTRALQWPARLLAKFPIESYLEDWLEKLLLDYPRSFEATDRLTANRPDLLLATGTFRYQEPAVTAAALKLKIPTLAFITSWDNPSTKGRMVLKYDGYLVWSEQVKNEMHQLYPHTRHRPMYVVGAPQFDVFKQPRFQISREEFCASQGLDPNRPYILYALGSPNFLQEHHGALFLAERIARGDFGDVQMLVRPHPIHDRGRESERFSGFGPRVVLQQTTASSFDPHSRTQDETQIRDWVNTFRHAAVLVNLSSTAAIDAALFDVPVINLDYDPQPGQADQELIKDINHVWTHFKPIAESGGVWLVANPEEMLAALRSYLANPAQHRAERRWMTEFVCGYTDGRCGERMAEAVLDFARHHLS